MSSLQLINITKTFSSKNNTITALDNVNLQVNDCDFVVVIGPSGGGKSTLLRTIAGLEKPDSGKIYLNNTLVNNINTEQRNLTLVSQSFSLYPHMTVFENIAFPLKMRKLPTSEITARVNYAAKLMGIDFLASRKPRVLSLGQCQRVAIARAIVRYPNIFLFDEPLSNLDAPNQATLKAELRRLHSELNATFIYVTHDIRQAMSLATKLAILDKGKLLQTDTPDVVYNAPACLQVAEYTSDIPLNTFAAEIKVTNEEVYAFSPTFSIALAKDSLPMEYSGKQVVLGVRATDFVFTACKEDAHFCGTVSKTEFIGKGNLLSVDTSTGLLKILSSDSAACKNTQVCFNVDNNKLFCFDAITGLAM